MTTERRFDVEVEDGQIVTNPGYAVHIEHEDCFAFEIDCKTKRGKVFGYVSHDDGTQGVLFERTEDTLYDAKTDKLTEVRVKHPKAGMWSIMGEMSRYSIMVVVWRLRGID